MDLRNIIKTIVKKTINAFGFDLVRVSDIPKALTMEERFGWMRKLRINSVIDVGANTGQFAGHIHRILPDAKIISFEPLRDCFQELQKNLANVPKFIAFNCALADSTGTVEMHRNDFTQSSSLLPMATLHKVEFPFTANVKSEYVEVKRLDDVLAGVRTDDNILLKIDVQGYEDKVILGGEETVSRAKMILLETSFETLYAGQCLFEDIYDLLRKRGFRFIGNWGQLVSPVDGKILQADSLFVRIESTVKS